MFCFLFQKDKRMLNVLCLGEKHVKKIVYYIFPVLNRSFVGSKMQWTRNLFSSMFLLYIFMNEDKEDCCWFSQLQEELLLLCSWFGFNEHAWMLKGFQSIYGDSYGMNVFGIRFSLSVYVPFSCMFSSYCLKGVGDSYIWIHMICSCMIEPSIFQLQMKYVCL